MAATIPNDSLLVERARAAGLTIARLSRIANVRALRLYTATQLKPDELERLEAVLRAAEGEDS